MEAGEARSRSTRTRISHRPPGCAVHDDRRANSSRCSSRHSTRLSIWKPLAFSSADVTMGLCYGGRRSTDSQYTREDISSSPVLAEHDDRRANSSLCRSRHSTCLSIRKPPYLSSVDGAVAFALEAGEACIRSAHTRILIVLLFLHSTLPCSDFSVMGRPLS